MKPVEAADLKAWLKLYLVIGSANCRKDAAEVVEEAIRGGVTMVQFREKGRNALEGAAKRELAGRILAVCRKHGVPLIVNDDVDLALALDADGVHIGQEDEPAEQVRKRIGNRILGLSVHSPEEARLGAERHADYFGVGPVFPTVSKEDARPVQGTAALRNIRGMHAAMPIVGIGGITADRVHEVIQAGADGVAVISAIAHTPDACHAAMELSRALTGVLSKRNPLVYNPPPHLLK